MRSFDRGLRMHTKSPFRAELNPRATRYALPNIEVVQAGMVPRAADGLNTDEIAAWLDTRREVVSRWCLARRCRHRVGASIPLHTNFGPHFESIARPFEWRSTWSDFNALRTELSQLRSTTQLGAVTGQGKGGP